MPDASLQGQSPPLTVVREPAHRPCRAARPAGRTVAPGSGAGRTGFVVLVVAGLAVNAWALFPSAVESGVVVTLPPLPGSAAPVADPEVVEEQAGGIQAMAFRLLQIDGAQAHPTSSRATQYSATAVGVAAVPLRSKLEALLLLLVARYGGNPDAVALASKLQALLRLPDSVLAQLVQRPELARLGTLLDGAFSAEPDLSGIKTELDKVDVNSTAGPSERVDVVAIYGAPIFVVRAAAAEQPTPDMVTAAMPVIPRPPVDFVLVTQVEAPVAIAAVMPEPTAEPTIAAPEPMVQMFTEVTVAPSIEPTLTGDPSFDEPTSAPEPLSDPDTWDDTEPSDTVAADEDEDEDTAETPRSVPSADPSEDADPPDAAEHTQDAGESAGDSGDGDADGTSGESTP